MNPNKYFWNMYARHPNDFVSEDSQNNESVQERNHEEKCCRRHKWEQDD